MLLHVAGETDSGIVVRGAKFETAAAYANQAFVKPTIGDWGDSELSDYAVGFVADMGAPGVKHICRSDVRRPWRRRRLSAVEPLRRDRHDDRLRRRRDPVGERPLLPHTRAAAFIRATLHRYSMFPFVQRHLRFADLMVGVAYSTPSRPGVSMHQAVREKLAELACYREGINAHLTRGDRVRRAEPGRAADAQPGAALHRPRAGLLPAAGDDAPRPRPVRRPAVRHPQRGGVRRARGGPAAATSTWPSATSTPSSAAGCSRSRGTC